MLFYTGDNTFMRTTFGGNRTQKSLAVNVVFTPQLPKCVGSWPYLCIVW